MKKKPRRKARARQQKRRRVELDRFTENQLDEWSSVGETIQGLSDKFYFDLERQRVARHDDLCAALRAYPAISFDLQGWTRVVDYRWSLTPLSSRGSLNGIGGRFNIGSELDRARGQAFPALYVAENVDTAYAEYFGGRLSSAAGSLSLGEFALRRESSFTTFMLTGCIDQVLDVRSSRALDDFMSIAKEFDISASTRSAIRSANASPRKIVKTSEELHQLLMLPPAEWRHEPQAYGIPATCQIFGRFARDAGFEAILFPSARGDGLNLAIFPENFVASSSRVGIQGETPAGATQYILDKDHSTPLG